MTGPTPGERIVAALESLGVERAHIGFGGFEDDVRQVVDVRPSAVGSLIYVLPSAAPASFGSGSWPVLAVFGRVEAANVRQARSEMESWPQLRAVELPPDYEAQPWSDPIADHPELIIAGIRKLGMSTPLPVVSLPPGERDIEGVRVRVEGQGPPLVLLPGGFWPTQWDAALPALARDFTVLRLGGAHIGTMGALEDRAAEAGYMRMVDALLDDLAISDGETVLEVGPGSGALVRRLAERVGNRNRVIAVDINAFFLDEAQALARQRIPEAVIDWRLADATNLPFDDGSIDVAFSVTALEECDADRALAEIHRVLRPGGRAGIIVRAVDLPTHWNLDLPDDMLADLCKPRGMVSQAGCGDRSLYPRFARHFGQITPSAHWFTSAPIMPFLVSNGASRLQPAQRDVYELAVARASADGTGFACIPHHCVVGTKA